MYFYASDPDFPMLCCRHSLLWHSKISRFTQVECTFSIIPTVYICQSSAFSDTLGVYIQSQFFSGGGVTEGCLLLESDDLSCSYK